MHACKRDWSLPKPHNGSMMSISSIITPQRGPRVLQSRSTDEWTAVPLVGYFFSTSFLSGNDGDKDMTGLLRHRLKISKRW
jgi:hypothetical protein